MEWDESVSSRGNTMQKNTQNNESQARKTSDADLRAAARLVAKLGGIGQAKLAIETLAKIRRAA